MSDSGDEHPGLQLPPDLPPNATPDQIIKQGRALREFHEASVRLIKEYEEALAAAVEKVKAEGSEDSAAAFIAKCRESLAAIKVAAASQAEQIELARELARELGLDIDGKQ